MRRSTGSTTVVFWAEPCRLLLTSRGMLGRRQSGLPHFLEWLQKPHAEKGLPLRPPWRHDPEGCRASRPQLHHLQHPCCPPWLTPSLNPPCTPLSPLMGRQPCLRSRSWGRGCSIPAPRQRCCTPAPRGPPTCGAAPVLPRLLHVRHRSGRRCAGQPGHAQPSRGIKYKPGGEKCRGAVEGTGGWKNIALLLGRKGNVKKTEVLAAWDHAPGAGRVSPIPRESWQRHWPQPPCRPWGLGSRIAAGHEHDRPAPTVEPSWRIARGSRATY